MLQTLSSPPVERLFNPLLCLYKLRLSRYPYHLGRQHRALKPLRAGGVPTGFPMLPKILKEAGYSTHMVSLSFFFVSLTHFVTKRR